MIVLNLTVDLEPIKLGYQPLKLGYWDIDPQKLGYRDPPYTPLMVSIDGS